MKFLLIFYSILCFSFVQAQERVPGQFFSTESRYDKIIYTNTFEVEKNLYGIHFKDRYIKASHKKSIERFFKMRLKGYLELKKYHLNYQERSSGIYINNLRVE